MSTGERQKKRKGEEQKTNWVREIVPYVVMILVVVLLRIFVLVNAYIPTNSMENTIMTDARVMGLKTAYWFHEPERGDIVVFWAPDLENTLYVKRLIGVPGDTVEVINGALYVNGEEQEEPYLKEAMKKESYGPYVVPEDSYFMMGDNRNVSLDARFWTNTYVTRDKVVGKVYFEYWPHPSWLAE